MTAGATEDDQEPLSAQITPVPAAEATALYRGLFVAAADALLVADAAGRYLDANPAATALLGYTRAELVQLGVADVVAAGPTWATAEYSRFVGTGTWRDELEVRRKDGTTVPVEAAATAVALPTHTVYVSALRDISERRALEQLQRDFLTVVTHELKSPLAAIRGYAQLLQRRGVYQAPAVETILSQATRLDRLIGDLLDVAQVQAGQLELRRTALDLGALAQEVAAQTQTLTTRHVVRVSVPPAPLIGWWDGDRLAQVVQNLLGNAVKYAPEGGAIEVCVWAEEGAAHLAVRDQGVGIPAEALPHIFERFYRTHAAVVSGAQGLGVGLAISQALVEAHGGRIDVESLLGQGSTFTVTLPLNAPVTDDPQST